MTDFTYVSQMNCRFVFKNPSSTGRYITWNVKAYGGVKTADNLYGDKFMGEYEFTDIFSTVSATVDYNSYVSTSYRLPSQSPWRNNTMHYAFSRNEIISAGRMSMMVYTLSQSSWGYADQKKCFAELGSTNDYDDMLYLDQTDGSSVRYLKAIFIRTWNANTNASTNGANGWEIKYMKCRFFSESYYAHWFFSDTSVEVATHTYDATALSALDQIFTNSTSMYFTPTYYQKDSSSNYYG